MAKPQTSSPSDPELSRVIISAGWSASNKRTATIKSASTQALLTALHTYRPVRQVLEERDGMTNLTGSDVEHVLIIKHPM